VRTLHLNHYEITTGKSGAARYTKASYPVRYGRYGEIKNKSRLPTFLYLIQRL